MTIPDYPTAGDLARDTTTAGYERIRHDETARSHILTCGEHRFVISDELTDDGTRWGWAWTSFERDTRSTWHVTGAGMTPTGQEKDLRATLSAWANVQHAPH